MGVLACDRRGCDNIMCDTYIPTVGYICNECKEEFIGTTEHTMTDAGIMYALTVFMDQYKNPYERDVEGLRQFFDKFTRQD